MSSTGGAAEGWRRALSCSAPLRGPSTPIGPFLTPNLCPPPVPSFPEPSAPSSSGPRHQPQQLLLPASCRIPLPERSARDSLLHLRRKSQNHGAGNDATSQGHWAQTRLPKWISSAASTAPCRPSAVIFLTHPPRQTASPSQTDAGSIREQKPVCCVWALPRNRSDSSLGPSAL